MKENNINPFSTGMKLLGENILFEDNHIIIINKLPSQIVQGDKTGDKPLVDLVKDYIKIKYKKSGEVFLGVVHRLDRPVSGAVIFARTSKSLTRINALIKNREIRKTYWAIVKNKPPQESDTLVNFLRRDETRNKSFITGENTKNSQQASLTYTLIGRSDNYYLLEIDLQTGRHHQIRTQLAGIGCPIKGDLKYGYPRSNSDGSIHLHARKLNFIHPVTLNPVSIIASTPNDPVWNYFEQNLS
ncbi:MAG: RNA pseudouridine synthase [Bacteroidales bacterium]|nr:RNA pseudouridine synthase [Bacteroidales bacterium]